MSTQAQLLDHAEGFVRARGFDAFSFADLAESAQIRKASVHYHFPAKSDLSLALITRYRSTFLEKLHMISDGNQTAGARVLGFLNLYRAASDSGRSLCLCVALSVTQNALPKDTVAELAAFHLDVTAWLEAAFRLAQADGSIRQVSDPRAEAQAAMAQAEGAQIMARAARDAARFEAGIQALVARII